MTAPECQRHAAPHAPRFAESRKLRHAVAADPLPTPATASAPPGIDRFDRHCPNGSKRVGHPIQPVRHGQAPDSLCERAELGYECFRRRNRLVAKRPDRNRDSLAQHDHVEGRKIKNTIGNSTLIGALCASSSARCRRRTRIASD